MSASLDRWSLLFGSKFYGQHTCNGGQVLYYVIPGRRHLARFSPMAVENFGLCAMLLHTQAPVMNGGGGGGGGGRERKWREGEFVYMTPQNQELPLPSHLPLISPQHNDMRHSKAREMMEKYTCFNLP